MPFLPPAQTPLQHVSVTLWLKKILGDQPIPQYEVNARTIDILYELAEHSEARDRDVSLLIDDRKQKAAEYEAEANYLQDLLTESLDFSLTSLSSEGTSYLNELVNSAMTLETKDTSLVSFISAINDLTSDLHATESKNREMELELTSIRKKLTAALVLEKRLQEDLKKTEEHLEVEKAKAESRSQNLKFLKDKSEDFKIRIKAAEEQLSATGLDQSLTHQSLVSLSEKLAELEQEIVPLKKKLESYLDLTPNPSLAQVKIEEAKRELNALEAEFSSQLDMLTLSMPEPSKLRFT
ncbi:HAUS augmin-like complex subunit 1 isoform X1 [Struthio camelus]|uniref:HAUS augmin-like complex subunit 1 isoform X1 n=1 Tax=Struthio camelus TaxID=8801 RepID=UPI0036042C00